MHASRRPRRRPGSWPPTVMRGPGSATSAASSSATPSSSRPAGGWPASTRRTTGWCSAGSTCTTARPATSDGSGLRNANRDVLLVDWRAPAAAVFYQATAQDPAGVVRRRVLQSFTDRVIGVEDDLLDPDHAPDDMVVVGEGALMAALSRSRDRSMQSIVATIQKEQDEAIRAPHRGVTTIAGGPGTGKTVVALHRAAYLLYTDRRRYESGGVLVVGPERRLHLLHRAGAPVARRDHRLAARPRRGRRRDPRQPGTTSPAVARIKGSARMRQVLSRTARGDGARRAHVVPDLLPRRRPASRPARAGCRTTTAAQRRPAAQPSGHQGGRRADHLAVGAGGRRPGPRARS